MASVSPPAKHWSVLVGINFYGGAEDLQGCVQDVWAIKQYLETGQQSVDIAALTATAPAKPTSRRLLEDPGCWPTWANLTNRLKRVLDNAKPGDFVYFHFSGHGTRLPESTKSAHVSGNLALVLFEESGPGVRYFQGQLLANCLGRMVEKGLRVTVVLDCCFSGSVLRDGNIRGTDVRAVDYNPDVDVGIPSGESSDYFQRDHHRFRDAAVSPDQWLVAPDGYTILAACGPHEIARELQLAQGGRRGALSYFLLDALNDLRKRCTEITHESLYEHLRVRFRASWPQQTPMRYGNKDMSFFGHLGARSDMAYVRVYCRAEDQRLCLDAGQAHGVYPNDEYAVYPLVSEDTTSQPEILATVRVENVGPLTSEVATTGQKRSIQGHADCWIAKPLTTLPRKKISVRLAASAHKFHGHILQTRGSEGQEWLHLCTKDEQEACMFHLGVNDGKYEILNGTLQRIRSLPTVPMATPDAEHHVLSMLQHLAEFKYAEGIESRLPDSSFDASFSLMSSADGNAPDASAVHNIEHGGIWRLALKNHSESPLYMAIFNFTPSWKIFNVLSSAGDNAFRVMQPRGEEELRMGMKVPDWLQRLGGRHCEDVIKVFVTAKPTSFPSLILPEIALHAQHRGGAHEPGDALATLLADLTRPLRGPNCLGREAWATRNFIIRTTMHGDDEKQVHA